MRRFLTLAAAACLLLLLVGGVVAAIGYRNAMADPVVRRATIALPGWPAGAPPVRVVLASDVHLGSKAMDLPRLRRMARIDAALAPDLVLLAGDFLDDRGREKARAAPDLTPAFRALHPPLGVVAVLGNHDHWTDPRAVTQALTRARVTVLDNNAIRRGPLSLGGVDDAFTGHADLPATLAAMRRTPGARVLLSHTPDVAPRLPADVTLLLAGHSHCGQVVLPLIGAPVLPLETGARYLCGLVRDGARTVIVTAGLGTSNAPVRIGAPADLWVLTLGPED